MNQRQAAFCREYVKTGNGTAAAIAAGYGARTARAVASRLLTNVNILEYIERLNSEISITGVAEAAEIRKFWTQILRNTQAKTSDRLRASENIARLLGLFLSRSVIELKNETAIDPVIIYGPDDPGGEKAVREFNERYPFYEGTLIVLPAIERDDDDYCEG